MKAEELPMPGLRDSTRGRVAAVTSAAVLSSLNVDSQEVMDQPCDKV